MTWDSDQTTLSDIQSLLRIAFHDKARHVMVKVVNQGNSIIVTCYAPCHLHEELATLVKDNEMYLRERKVLSIIIGGFVILQRETRGKVRVFSVVCKLFKIMIYLKSLLLIVPTNFSDR